jgi:hypothetical protein
VTFADVLISGQIDDYFDLVLFCRFLSYSNILKQSKILYLGSKSRMFLGYNYGALGEVATFANPIYAPEAFAPSVCKRQVPATADSDSCSGWSRSYCCRYPNGIILFMSKRNNMSPSLLNKSLMVAEETISREVLMALFGLFGRP